MIAIIPAREGSKRLINKNITDFCGKPLIYYSIETAKNSKEIDDYYVSTDSEKIGNIAKSFGSKVIIRPQNLAEDTSTLGAVLNHAQKVLAPENPNKLDFVLLQPTQPLRDSMLVDQAIQYYQKNKRDIDTLMTVCRTNLKFGRLDNNVFEPINYYPEQRSQEMEKTYFENGFLYIVNGQTIQQRKVFGKRIYGYPIDELYGKIDIDTPEDLKFAEIVFKNNRK